METDALLCVMPAHRNLNYINETEVVYIQGYYNFSGLNPWNRKMYTMLEIGPLFNFDQL